MRITIPHGGSFGMLAFAYNLLNCSTLKKPDDRVCWKKRFEQFRLASGLAEENEVKQVSTLMYSLGEEAEAVLSSTNIKEKERTVYETVLHKFDSFFW